MADWKKQTAAIREAIKAATFGAGSHEIVVFSLASEEVAFLAETIESVDLLTDKLSADFAGMTGGGHPIDEARHLLGGQLPTGVGHARDTIERVRRESHLIGFTEGLAEARKDDPRVDMTASYLRQELDAARRTARAVEADLVAARAALTATLAAETAVREDLAAALTAAREEGAGQARLNENLMRNREECVREAERHREAAAAATAALEKLQAEHAALKDATSVRAAIQESVRADAAKAERAEQRREDLIRFGQRVLVGVLLFLATLITRYTLVR